MELVSGSAAPGDNPEVAVGAAEAVVLGAANSLGQKDLPN